MPSPVVLSVRHSCSRRLRRQRSPRAFSKPALRPTSPPRWRASRGSAARRITPSIFSGREPVDINAEAKRPRAGHAVITRFRPNGFDPDRRIGPRLLRLPIRQHRLSPERSAMSPYLLWLTEVEANNTGGAAPTRASYSEAIPGSRRSKTSGRGPAADGPQASAWASSLRALRGTSGGSLSHGGL